MADADMQWVRGMMMAVVLCCAAGAAVAEERPDARLQEAQSAFDEANTLWDAGQYADAISRGEQALTLREAVLGGTHPDVATCLDMLGLHRLLQGDAAQAEPLLQRALAIRESALGNHHPDIARTLNTLANLYADQALYGQAEPLYARALLIREAVFGKNHSSVAETLNNLANLYRAQRLYARAEPLYERALAIREAALGKDHAEGAQTLHDLAWLYELQGLYGRAEPLYERALAIREVALGKDHALVADSLHRLAGLYLHVGLNARAEPLQARAVAIREAALGKNPPDVATSLLQLANVYLYVGLNARAEPLLQRAVAIREAVLGKNHPLVADPLSWLGYFYFAQGVYGRAEPLLERVVAIREAAQGENHPLVADVLLDLGDIYVAQGLYARAEPILQRALAIRRGAFGENSRFVATALLGLGRLYVAQGLYARAEPLLQRGLAIEKATFGANHVYVATTLCRLGNFYVAQGLYARAEPLLRRALAIQEASTGRNHESVATPLNNLADLYSAQGLYGRARPLYERALAILEATLGENHPSVAETLNHLGVLHLAQRRLAEALPLLTRAFALSEQRLRRESLGFSEERLASFLQFLRTDEERLYALLRAHPDDVNVRRLALGAALLLKGRSVEESSDISRTVYRSLGAQDRDTFERLQGLRTQLAQLSLQGPGSLPPAAYQRRLEELAEQGTALEADLARRSAPLRALAALPSPAEIVDRVAAALPKDAALVEFITYVDRPLVPRPGTPRHQRPGQLRYLALVLFPDATLRFRDLGPAEPVDSAALRLRDALANRDVGFQAPAQALYQLAFQPLLPLLGATHRLFLSPDGQLALVPFAALHDGQQFLVDVFDFTYLPSGKNLLPRPQESAPPGSVVVLADPDFSAPLPARPLPQEDAPALAERAMPSERSFSMLRADLAQRAWALTPLPGTRQEAEAIQRLLPQAQLFLGPEATKERLLQLPPPGILHLATHGFFLEDAPQLPASRAVVHFGELGEETLAPSPSDPLLRSGLVLAGASAPASSGSSPAQPSAEHALVTALELAGLNLWGTQLVVLSACDTGRGDVKLGQGVYGLRRAFLVAGAETVVMSLWKVNDETTRTLMEAYYRHLLGGQGRSTALREAMRELRRTQPHPHYWAPFLAMGRETPLRLLASSAQETHRQ
ncbi:CHAT domain-containing tetratricopeptide repeat protein [Hyalangium sp.]|uniref:CHAT domain-containing tetratricopeptide repeat protein n=1 Tax=Hyalangium sp. TaxID=2028555 RepID=UPI002D643A5F|nr:CHAT domain-containing tetratricopeptide repeat protein [Hyalangium sp.]HYI00692.1 CHAT domain-containing tetratricopeptide repeat protein [Hyalangium sp.]